MKNSILHPSHLGDIPQASSSNSQFSGSKRKFGSPKKKKKNEYVQSSVERQERPFMSRVPSGTNADVLQPRKKLHEQGHYEDPFVQRWQCGSVFHGHRVAFGTENEDDVDAMACCSSSSMTSLGQFGVWYPEDSVVKKPRNLMRVPSVEDLEAMYKLPRRRQRDREDGPVGALLFDIAEPFANSALKYDHLPDLVEFAAQHERGSSKEGVSEHTKAGGAALQSNMSFFEADDGLAFSDLRTGDDAIGYFKELESGGPVQLVYCNRTSTGKEFTPYDLSVVPRSLVNPEHFIISPAGIVHIEPGPGHTYSFATVVPNI